MIDSTVSFSFAAAHPDLSYWLDESIKLGAVALGGVWTYWNYRKSRTYEQKLELELTGSVFFKDGLYVDVAASLKNTGASRFLVREQGTSCTISAIVKDLSVVRIRLFRIFALHDQMEPGESINDALFWRIVVPPEDIVWLRIDLRIVSGEVEWNSVALLRVGAENLPQRVLEGE